MCSTSFCSCINLLSTSVKSEKFNILIHEYSASQQLEHRFDVVLNKNLMLQVVLVKFLNLHFNQLT